MRKCDDENMIVPHFCLLHCRMMIGALVLLIVVIATNYSMLGFVSHGLYIYGAWLYKNHRVDLWLLRVLVSIATVQYLLSHLLKEPFCQMELRLRCKKPFISSFRFRMA